MDQNQQILSASLINQIEAASMALDEVIIVAIIFG